MDEVNNFLHKYEAHATLSDRKHYAKRIPMSLSDYHRYNTAMDVYSAESYVQREPYVEMYIPQHRFQELVEQDRYYTKLHTELDYATQVAKQQAEDRLVRLQNPSVKQAYEKYKMLLELARR